jgi:DNA (cytosine-5)-methyltransferase 1
MDFESETFITGSLMNSGKAAGSATQQDAETGMLVTASVSCRPYADRGAEEYGLITHSLRAEGFDAAESGQSGKGDAAPLTMTGMQVRRLTPVECARLQAVPDTHLDILHRGKPLADGPRYKLLGNSFCINVVKWIGERIQQVENLHNR